MSVLAWVEQLPSGEFAISRVHYKPDMLSLAQKVGGIELPDDFEQVARNQSDIPVDMIPFRYCYNPETHIVYIRPSVELDTYKQMKIQVIKEKCAEVITAGFDSNVKGGEIRHYNLTYNDQLNIAVLYNRVVQGAPAVPWHHAGQTICELWTAEEFTAFYNEGMSWLTGKRFYSDGLEEMILRATTYEEIAAIYWGMELASDIQAQINAMIG